MVKNLAAISLSLLTGIAAAQDSAPFAIGLITDMSGPNSGVGGKGAIEAARMAIEDFGGRVLNRPVTLVTADHLNKADVASSIAKKWLDEGTVQALTEGTGTVTTAAMLAAAKSHNRVMLMSGTANPIFYNEQCSDYGVHFTYDTNGLARTIVAPLIKKGLDTWYFVTVDFATGHAIVNSIKPQVEKLGGKVVGQVLHPNQTTDFSSYLLQAQASKAKVIVAANVSGDTVNTMKQAQEFQIGSDGKQVMATSVLFLSDIRAMGLDTAKNLFAGVSFYWDKDESTRSFSRRFQQRTGFPPEMTHAGTYSAVLHYLKAVQAAGTVEAAPVTRKMKELPVNDFWNKNVKIRADGQVLHSFYLTQVKTPSESKGPFDLMKIVAELRGEEATPSIEEGKCAAAKQRM